MRASPLIAVACLASLLGVPAVASAQSYGAQAHSPQSYSRGCAADGPRPVLCSLSYRAAIGNERWRTLDADERLSLPAGESAVLQPEGVDQNGRKFPADRLWVGVEPERDCRGLLETSTTNDGQIRLRAGTERGRCTVLIWVPGNLNLEFPLRVEVVSRARDGYSRGEAEHIARSLYAAVLGRQPDAPGLSAAVTEIQRGRLDAQVEAMFGSREFADRSAGMAPAALLEQIYQGLLGREPDSDGVRTYLEQVSRRRAAGVVLSIVRSEEYERQLVGKRLG